MSFLPSPLAAIDRATDAAGDVTINKPVMDSVHHKEVMKA